MLTRHPYVPSLRDKRGNYVHDGGDLPTYGLPRHSFLGRKSHDVRLVQHEDDAYQLRIPPERNKAVNAAQFGAERRHAPRGVGLHAALSDADSTSAISASDSPS